ncbi:hypothetical protein F9288_05900 [Sphingomonas sp. CL5.1]|uniref:hypothetical protein n=1 Tax=Sphingomonas sp. CL5.1 TaxID=2653203 RepID=UPI0015836AD1|nr:hypothetical protein [Sphingomonas sp. CL5.1]MBN8840938.1 hypothetical protein [Sphingomonadales bacterium]QKR99235.1 hypothetical protein F9288_05900 [Sphingomonas sp. CL5.1]
MTRAPCIATAQPIYGFVPVQRDGLYLLLLVDTQMPFLPPLHVMAFETSAQWDVAAKWLLERKNHWQSWGALARISRAELSAQVKALLEAEPMDPAVEACVFAESPDGRTLTLSELVRDRKGRQGRRQVWCRTFGSRAKCRRAKAWILRHYPQLDELAVLVREEGSDAVDALLDRGGAGAAA